MRDDHHGGHRRGDGNNARILKLDRMGTVAVKKEADFIVLDANPLDDIVNTLRISTVYLRGKEIDRKGLRARFMAAGKKSQRIKTPAYTPSAGD